MKNVPRNRELDFPTLFGMILACIVVICFFAAVARVAVMILVAFPWGIGTTEMMLLLGLSFFMLFGGCCFLLGSMFKR